MPDQPATAPKPDTPTAAPIITAPRTLRCANAALYAGFTLIVWAAALYAGLFREADIFIQAGATAACLVSLLWGGYYVLLRYEVDAGGITRRRLGRGTRLNWADLTCARLQQTDTQETISVTLYLETPAASLTLSSDYLAPDDVLELARELGASEEKY